MSLHLADWLPLIQSLGWTLLRVGRLDPEPLGEAASAHSSRPHGSASSLASQLD